MTDTWPLVVWGVGAAVIIVPAVWLAHRKDLIEAGRRESRYVEDSWIASAIAGAFFWPLVATVLLVVGLCWGPWRLIDRTATKSARKKVGRERSLKEREERVARMERELGIEAEAES